MNINSTLTQSTPIYVFEVVENNMLTVQFLASSDDDLKIAKEFNAIKHTQKTNIWYWKITNDQDIRSFIQKSKKFVSCFIRNTQKCADYFRNYLKFKKLQHHTINCYVSSVNIILNQFPSIESQGKIPSFDEILEFFNKQNWMQSYINQHINALKKLFFEILFIDRKEYRFDRPQNEVRIRNILNNNEINLLTSYQPGSRTNLLIETALYTGLKTNELENLRVTDFSGNRLNIIGIRPRIIEIPNHLTNKINSYLNSNNIENREYVFSNNVGKKLSKSTLQGILRNVRIELNLEQITLKDLRHTFSINAFNNGIEIEKIQKHLGYIGFYSTLEYFSLINHGQRLEMMNICA